MTFYQKYVLAYANKLTGIVGAMAQDLARLLDEPLFAINPSNAFSMVSVREAAYGQFCAACQAVSVPLPPLDPIVLEYHLPKHDACEEPQIRASLKLAQELRQRTDGSSDNNHVLCYAVALMLETFPSTGGFRGIERKGLVAVANRALLNLGQEPIRDIPELELPPDDVAPERPVTVLIVDDTPQEIFSTALELVGWPNIAVDWILQGNGIGFSISEKEREQELDRLTQEILAKQPDVVLMDQGMKGVEGSDIVPLIRQKLPNVVVIANTGGSADELMAVGAVGSANKGRTMQRAWREARQYL